MMEIKEAIERVKRLIKNDEDDWNAAIESMKENYNTDKTEKRFKEIKQENSQIIDLLQSLETTIKGYETAYTKAVLEKDKLKKELEAYKGRWIELPNRFEDVVLNDSLTEISKCMDVLKEEYLGGGE
jgi:chromosome segregation ATPase